MRKIVSVISAVVALVGVSSVASAQDGRRFNWSGVYFGAGAGSVTSKSDWTYPQPPVANPLQQSFSVSTSDAIVALHAGYQHQFMGGLVIGAEMGYGRTLGANFGGTACPNATLNCQARVDDVFTIGGRLGFGIDNLLLYASGGYAQANVSTQATAFAGGAPIEVFSVKHGGTYVGGGFEYALTRSFSVGVDYKHIDLASEGNCITAASCGVNPSRTIDPVSDVVTARFSYKFNDERHYRPLK